MARNHTAPFKKLGPRAERMIQNEAQALVERQCEEYVRQKMKPELVANARRAQATMKRQDWK